MSEKPFGEPDETRDDWVDVRMTDPDEGEWDVDVVVLDGQVEYVDIRINPDVLESFVECLLEDVGEARAETILSALIDSESGTSETAD